jgi:hypothetical protein
MKQILAGMVVVVIIALVFGGYWWWLQVDSGENSAGLFSKEGEEKKDVVDEGKKVIVKEPKSITEAREVACVGAGGLNKFNINEVKAEDSVVVQEIVYVRCGNGEEKEYTFDKKVEKTEEVD